MNEIGLSNQNLKQWKTPRGIVTLVSACPLSEIEKLEMDAGLGFFWHNCPDRQHAALIRIASQPQGRVTLAYTEERKIVGFVTVMLPDAHTRWGRDRIADLYELGGIEVAKAWRGLGLSRRLLDEMFGDGLYDKAVVLATGYRWCWDVESYGMAVREYRAMLNRLFKKYGFRQFDTDEPNVAMYPDNALIARIGKKAPKDLVSKFKGLLFKNFASEYSLPEFAGR